MKKSITFLFSLLLLINILNATGYDDYLKQKALKNRTTDISEEEPVKDVHIFREGGTLPEYSTGDVWQYINDNVYFPAEITLNRSDNSVIVHFIVEKDGALNSFNLYAGSYPALDNEVLRVAKKNDKMAPG